MCLRRRQGVPYLLATALLFTACRSTRVTDAVTAPADTLAARITPVGSASTLDIGTWNLEWFGDAGNGPANEALQLSTVRSAMAGMNLDIVGVQEIVSQTQWDALEAALPDYSGFLAGEDLVTGGPGSYSRGEQKVGILFKRSLATLVSARVVLAANDFEFAGRPPLEVTLRVSINGRTQDLVVLVLHMKAFTDVESWQRRANAAIALKAYLDATWPTQRVTVIGDWNDDLDNSITSSRGTPYLAFLADSTRYAFPTLALSLARVPTTDGFREAIDHHLVTNELSALFVAGSARAIALDQVISSYAQVTSDHFPVVSSYTWR